ncbi:MAG: hypothetical protein LBG80_17815 [Bacteroidales bacterium]|nr:hypothetical protein [Bacteroidales bacterium]
MTVQRQPPNSIKTHCYRNGKTGNNDNTRKGSADYYKLVSNAKYFNIKDDEPGNPADGFKAEMEDKNLYYYHYFCG